MAFVFKHIVLGIGIVLTALILTTEPAQTVMKRLYLKRAKIVGRVPWRDILYARSVLSTNEPNAKSIHIGRRSENGRNMLVIVTESRMYQSDEKQDGRWQLIGMGPYNP